MCYQYVTNAEKSRPFCMNYRKQEKAAQILTKSVPKRLSSCLQLCQFTSLIGKCKQRFYRKKHAFCYQRVTNPRYVIGFRKHRNELYPEAAPGARPDARPLEGKWKYGKKNKRSNRFYNPIEAHVCRPIIPSGVNPRDCWKSRTAFSVFGP